MKAELPGGAGAFLQAPGSTNDHDLGAVQHRRRRRADSTAGRSTVGLYHLAWEVETLADLEEHAAGLAAAGALVGASDHGTTKSLYAQDPDGIEFEVVWIIPAHLLTEQDVQAAGGRPRPLDLEREKRASARDTRGGLGISVPLGVGL